MVHKNIVIEEKQAYNQLLHTCLSSLEKDVPTFDSLKQNVSHLTSEIQKQVDSFKQKISTLPLSIFIILWADLTRHDKIYANRYLTMMNDLIEERILNSSSILQNISEQDSYLIIDKIRCHKKWLIPKREDYVLLYRIFSEWLSKETCNYIPEAKDSDRIATHLRRVSFETYIQLLNHLKLREQILVKLFYLGGARALEEILSVKIQDLDFKKCSIHFTEPVSYPPHLFEDIKIYIEDRNNGYLFVGRNGERMSHSTPFRSLKTAVSKLKLDPEFTFKDLTNNS